MLYCLFDPENKRPVLSSVALNYINNPGHNAVANDKRGCPIRFRVAYSEMTMRAAYNTPHPGTVVMPLGAMLDYGIKDIRVDGFPFVDDRDPNAPD